jgi:LysM repeat protein
VAVYIVQPGDYLMKIARTCGANLDDLVAFNPDIVDLT